MPDLLSNYLQHIIGLKSVSDWDDEIQLAY